MNADDDWRKSLSDDAREILTSATDDSPSPERLTVIAGGITIAAAVTGGMASGAAATVAASSATAAKGATMAWFSVKLVGVVLVGAAATGYVASQVWSEGAPHASIEGDLNEQPVSGLDDLSEESAETRVEPVEVVGPSPPEVATMSRRPVSPGTSEELALIQRIEALRSTNPAEALQAIRTHQRIYGAGVFGPERELYRVEALIELGRRPEARRAATRFARRFPGSPYGARIRALVTPE